MARGETQVTGTVLAVTRRPSSSLGNPAWRIRISDPDSEWRDYVTSANASVSYAIGQWLVGKPVTLTITRAWRIIGMVE